MICTMPKAKKEKVSFRYVWETHLQPSNVDAKCTKKHIQEMELYLTRWEAFWNQSKRKQPKVQRCEREHLETYRRHLISLDRYSDRSINKHLGVIRSLLVSAAKHGLLKRRPMLEQLPDVSLDPARKIWLRDEQIEGARFKPYCLRKTCATHMSAHKTGLATAICRWGSSGEAGVATEHYIGSDNIIRFLLDAPMPKSFDTLLTAT
jgi:hypothetical protein